MTDEQIQSFAHSRLLWITLAVCFLVVVLHIVGFFTPSGLDWGISYFAFLPSLFLVCYVFAVIAVVLYLLSGKEEPVVVRISAFMEKSPWIFLGIVCALYAISAVLLQIKVPLLGDSFVIIKNYDNEFNGVHALWTFRSPAAVYYFSFIIRVFGLMQYPAMLKAFLLGDLVIGAGYLICMFFTVKNLFSDPVTRLFVYCFLICMPYMQIFFGYVEVYSVLIFAFSLFFFAVTSYLNGETRFVIVVIIFIYMGLAHLMSMMLGPIMVYLAYLEFRKNGMKQVWISAGVAILFMFVLFASLDFNWKHIVNVTPHSNFLSIRNTNEPYQAYTLFSPYHGIELLNAMMLIAPLTILFLIFGIVYRKLAILKNPIELILLASTGAVFAFVCLAKFDYGMAKDWDISASLMVVASLCAVVLLLRTGDRSALKSVQIAAAVMALTSLPWFYLNSTVEGNIKRSESYMDTRVVSREGYYLATMHLTSHYINTNDIPDAAKMLRQYIALYPNDFWVYQMLTRTLIDYGNVQDPEIDRVFQQWLDRAPSDTVCHSEYAAYSMDMGTMYYKERKLDSAFTLFKKALSLNPGSAGAYNNVGLIYYQENDYTDAIPYFRQALAINPEYITASLNLASAYMLTSKADSAIEQLTSVIHLDNRNITAYENLSKAYYQKGEKAQAIATLKKAAQLGSKMAQYLLTTSGEKWE